MSSWEEAARARGLASGEESGHEVAFRDGSRIGRLHGAALASELGAFEAFACVALCIAGRDGGARVGRAAEQLRDAVRALGVGGEAVALPGGDVDVVAEVGRCRGKAKLLAAVAGLPPAVVDELAGGAAVAAASRPQRGEAAVGDASPPLSSRAALDF